MILLQLLVRRCAMGAQAMTDMSDADMLEAAKLARREMYNSMDAPKARCTYRYMLFKRCNLPIIKVEFPGWIHIDDPVGKPPHLAEPRKGYYREPKVEAEMAARLGLSSEQNEDDE
jgi:hypothetical protein